MQFVQQDLFRMQLSPYEFPYSPDLLINLFVIQLHQYNNKKLLLTTPRMDLRNTIPCILSSIAKSTVLLSYSFLFIITVLCRCLCACSRKFVMVCVLLWWREIKQTICSYDHILHVEHVWYKSPVFGRCLHYVWWGHTKVKFAVLHDSFQQKVQFKLAHENTRR